MLAGKISKFSWDFNCSKSDAAISNWIFSLKAASFSSTIFDKALENIMPKIEVRPKRVGGSIYQVPQEVEQKRQLFLASKWIIDSARSKKGASFSKFLANELIEAANETGTAFKKKLEVYKMAEANKAFARFANKKR